MLAEWDTGRKCVIWQGLVPKTYLVYLAVAGSTGPQLLPVPVCWLSWLSSVAGWQAAWWTPFKSKGRDGTPVI